MTSVYRARQYVYTGRIARAVHKITKSLPVRAQFWISRVERKPRLPTLAAATQGNNRGRQQNGYY